MGRIRSIKPDFFRDGKLQDIENDNPTLKPMLVFAGLWTAADKNGVFEWDPRMLKLDILPFLCFDMVDSLSLLERFSFVSRFEVGGKKYGMVQNFSKHQRIQGKEAISASKFPIPSPGIIREATEQQPGLLGREGEGKGKGGEEIPPDLHPNQYATKLLEEVNFPVNPQNIRAVASAIECEVTGGKSKASAYEFLLSCTLDAMQEGFPITTYFFTEAKYRPTNRRNGNGTKRQTSAVEQRVKGNREVLSEALRDHIAQRVGPNSDQLKDGDGTPLKRRVSAGAV